MSAYGEYGDHGDHGEYNDHDAHDDYDDRPVGRPQVALVDLLDRLLSGGVVLTGDLVLSISDIDLVRISLRAVIVSIREQMDEQWGPVLPGGRTPGGRSYADRDGYGDEPL